MRKASLEMADTQKTSESAKWTKGYTQYRAVNDDVPLSFLDSLPPSLDFVRNGADADFVKTDERFGEYLAKCVAEKRKVAPYTFCAFFYKKGDWFMFPFDEDATEEQLDDVSDDTPAKAVVRETGEGGVVVSVRSKDYAAFVSAVQEVQCAVM